MKGIRKGRLLRPLTPLCLLCVLYVSVVSYETGYLTTETRSAQRWHNVAVSRTQNDTIHEITRNHTKVISHQIRVISWIVIAVKSLLKNQETPDLVYREPLNTASAAMLASSPQDRRLDYSTFLHTSQKHASLACTGCHERAADNSATPRFPGHKACTSCHLAQFVTPAVPMCDICHSNLQSSNPPLKAFPSRFNERFNVKFDHAQHMAAGVRPRNGCAGCHSGSLMRGAALSIPASVNAHNGCYSCHTPASKSLAGREMASCGVCHDQKSYVRTSTNSRAFRFAFSHAKHGPRQRLACADCHSLTAGAPQMRQVSSPSPTEHFPMGRVNCLTCHNGRREFGGDLAFKDCRKCHTGQTFR